MTNIYLEKIASWAEDEYKNPATKYWSHGLIGSGAGAAVGSAVGRVLGKGKAVHGALVGAGVGSAVGGIHGALTAEKHNSKIDQRASADPDFQRKVDEKVLAHGKRSVVGNALITPYLAGGVSAYQHNRDRYDAALARLKSGS